MTQSRQPLNWQASAAPTNAQTAAVLPEPVHGCLRNARFLHLATCEGDVPHVALMNYTYLTDSPYRNQPIIVMTTNLDSRKTIQMQANPRVALLAHDWVSHRPPTARSASERDASPPNAPPATSSLATLLLNLNSSALSRISATINGRAELLQPGSEEERWCKTVHLENNTFDEAGLHRSAHTSERGEGTTSNGCFIEGEDVRVILVQIEDGRIADWKGGVQDWNLTSVK